MSLVVLVVLTLLAVAFWRHVLAVVLAAATVVFVVGCVDVAQMLQTGSTTF